MCSLIRNRRLNRAWCPKCKEPDYSQIWNYRDEETPPKSTEYMENIDGSCETFRGIWDRWRVITLQYNKKLIEGVPVFQCNSCKYIFQSDFNSSVYKYKEEFTYFQKYLEEYKNETRNKN